MTPITLTHAKTSARVCGLNARPIQEGAGHNVSNSEAREGRIDPVGDRLRGGLLTTVLEGTCLVRCCHAKKSSQDFARAGLLHTARSSEWREVSDLTQVHSRIYSNVNRSLQSGMPE